MKFKEQYSDYIGIISAFLCLIHCLAGPILMSAGLIAHNHTHGFGGDEHAHGDHFLLHRGWDFFFLAIGLIAVIFSTRHTPTKWIKSLLWITYAFLAGAILLEEQAPFFQYLVYLSSVALIAAHYVNISQLIKAIRRGKESTSSGESTAYHA